MLEITCDHRRSLKTIPTPRYFLLRFSLFICLALILPFIPGKTALAGSKIQEFVVPEETSAPHSIAVDPQGNVWFAEKVGKKLSIFNLGKTTFKSYPLPVDWGNVGPSTIAIGLDGKVWFSVSRWAEANDSIGFLGQYDPSTEEFRQFPLSQSNVSDPASEQSAPIPEDLLVDDHGLVWFLSPNENKLYRYNPDNADLHGYQIPTQNSYPKGLSMDGNGTIWFAEANANKIGKFLPQSAAFSEYEIPTPFANPEALTFDPLGRVWFVEMRTNRLSVFYPDMERFDEALIPTAQGMPNAIASDSKGRIWFLEYLGNKIGVFDPVQAQFKEFDIPTYGSYPGDMAIDIKKGLLWFSETNTEARRLGMLPINDIDITAAAAHLEHLKISATSSAEQSSFTILFTVLAALMAVLALLTTILWRRGKQ